MTNKSEKMEREFGLLMACVLMGVGAFVLYRDGSMGLAAALLVLGGGFGALGLFAPARLARATKLWMKFSEILGKIVSPVVMGIIFFGLITPIGLLGKALGRDELRLKRGNAPTYWRLREAPQDSSSFKNQF